MISRRQAIVTGSAAIAGRAMLFQKPATTLGADAAATSQPGGTPPSAAGDSADPKLDQVPQRPGEPGRDYTPVVTPNGWTLPYKVVEGVKVFHLIAEEVDHEFAPGLHQMLGL